MDTLALATAESRKAAHEGRPVATDAGGLRTPGAREWADAAQAAADALVALWGARGAHGDDPDDPAPHA